MKKRNNISSVIFMLTAFIAIIICYVQQANAQTEQIINVENGLIEAAPMAENIGLMLDSKRTDSLAKFNILDRMKIYNVPGVSIAVIKNFKLEWAKSYGVLESGTSNMVTTETLFQAASTSKPLATAIVLRLVEEGKLSLDEDVNTYLKSWKIPYDTIKSKVTLRLLITHKAGINRPGQGIDFEKNSSPTIIQVLNGELPAMNDPFHFDHAPGTFYQYSNSGYMIIQLVLEDYLKKPYKEIVQEYIFDPLKMKSSYMQFPLPTDVMAKLSKPHNQAGVPQEYGIHPSALAHAGLITTPSDLSKFAVELMLASKGKSNKILKQESVNSIFNKTADVDPNEFSGFSQLGFGVFLLGEGEKKYFVHPGGNNSGASCALFASESSGDGVIVMTNGIYGLYLSIEIIASVANEYGWRDIK
ncbi:MAG: hypothetical protein A2W99_16505 [Bacteroidetes bacterium GWF2_33_16]|nr:MAG: hypothetical protein A2W99_16505 [Bacteroidetes bacterium GWF2_33_16]